MFENNNKKAVNKISKRMFKVNKMRNIFSVLAIALTTLLITIAIIGSVTLYKASKSYMNVSSYGTDADGYINIEKDSEEKLNTQLNITSKVLAQLASEDVVKNNEIEKDSVCLENLEGNGISDMMAIVPIKGDYPKNSNDVLVPTWVLEALGIKQEVGSKINLDVVINEKVENLELNVCGFYESFVAKGVGRSRILVSKSFIDTYNPSILNQKGTKTAFVNLKNINNSLSYDEVQKELEELSKSIGAGKAKAHPKYQESKTLDGDLIKQIAATMVLIIMIALAAYLIIYNIFYISITKDIRFYGLLKTIGTTKKQIKSIVIRQAFILSIIGIPIGLILGYIIAKILLPIALSFTTFSNIVVVQSNFYIFIIAAVFSLVTVLISVNKPGRIAGKISAVEAVKFVGIDNKSKKSKKGYDGARVHKMAWNNLVKNKKRAIISILSISLSGVIIIFTIMSATGIDPIKHAESQMIADIEVTNAIGHFYGETEYEPISLELIEKIKELDYVSDVRVNYSAIEKDENGQVLDFGVDMLLDGVLKKEIEEYENIRWSMLNPSSNTFRTRVAAIKSDRLLKELEKFKVVDGEIDVEKFKTGKYIIYNPVTEKTSIKAGDKLPLNLKMPDENGVYNSRVENFEVMAVTRDNLDGFAASNFSEINIEENAFKNIFKNYKESILGIEIDLKDGVNATAAEEEINNIVGQSGNRMLSVLSKNYYIDGMKQMQGIISLVGGVLAFILGLIGAINVINTMLTSLFTRKIEFAMLESIGMTKKQIKKMMLFESLYYIALTTVIIIPFGILNSSVIEIIIPVYTGFNFMTYLIALIICIILFSIIMLIAPILGYRYISKESITQRLRAIE